MSSNTASRFPKLLPGRASFALALAASATLSIAGCASGSSSSASPAPVVTPAPPTSTNSPSLPALSAATQVNTYSGSQVQAPSAPANVVSLELSHTGSSYAYQGVSLANMQPDPLPDSTGSLSLFQDFTALGDSTGATMDGMPGPQYFGMVIEEQSRLAFFAPYTGQQLVASVPMQTASCVTPTAAATYQFVTLFNSSFVPATDSAWGTVSVDAGAGGFTFTNAQQFIQPATAASTAATTSLVPFAAANCIQSSSNPELGYFIDTPASAASNQVEIQSFLGPTGLLVANLQGADSSGNPLPLASVLGMVQPASAIDLTQVIGSVSSGTTYKSFLYQPAGSPAMQYGLVGQESGLLSGVDDTIFTSTNTNGIVGSWQGLTSFSSLAADVQGGGGILFGAQDPKNPGLFPAAQFLYAGTATAGQCPSGTSYLAGDYCSSPAVAMVGMNDGKYVILATGAYQASGGTPAVMIMLQD